MSGKFFFFKFLKKIILWQAGDAALKVFDQIIHYLTIKKNKKWHEALNWYKSSLLFITSKTDKSNIILLNQKIATCYLEIKELDKINGIIENLSELETEKSPITCLLQFNNYLEVENIDNGIM